MFLKVAKVKNSITFSLVKSYREGEKTRHRHVAYVGSIAQKDMDRRNYMVRYLWKRLEEKLAELEVDKTTADRIRKKAAERVPPMTAEEWKELKVPPAAG